MQGNDVCRSLLFLELIRVVLPRFLILPFIIAIATINFSSVSHAQSAQRAVLYEDDPTEPAGRMFAGVVTWKTENSPQRVGGPPDLAIRAEITIPDRNMRISLIVRRNMDPKLSASYTVSILFNLPPEFPNGGISEIRGILMKKSEDTRGTRLIGLAVKVTPTFFLLGLSSSSGADVRRNLLLLKERSWLDIAIVYTSGRRAILAVEKGAQGDRAFADAFAVWNEKATATPQVGATLRRSSGTAFFVSNSGHLVTNAHVVEDCVTLRAIDAGGTEIPLAVVSIAKSDDLALLKAPTQRTSVAVFRQSTKLNQGEAVIAYGYPLSGLLASSGNVSTGIITALAGISNDARQIQISAPVQPGSSGGPLVDSKGSVVGIVVAKLDAMAVAAITDDIPQNINFAIKASAAINLLDANSVQYRTDGALQDLSVQLVTERMKEYTVKVECN
jgi:S1-C subfamily serine protease